MLKKGQSLVELLLFIGILAVFLPGLMTALVASREGRPQMQQRLQAATILKETQEQVRSVREQGWEVMMATITPGVAYHPVTTGASISLTAGVDNSLSNTFTRQVVFGNVIRNNSGNIVPTPTPGTTDPSTTQVTTTVNWTQPYSSKLESTMYLTRFRDNIAHDDIQSVTLPSGGLGDWCSPNLSLNAVDLPKSGVANAITAIEGRVFAGTGENSAGVSFANISISDTNPPVGTSLGTFDDYKTNAVFGEGNFAYLATDNNSQEIVIMSLTQFSNPPTNSKFLQVGSINLPGNINANSIYVNNNIAYVLGSNNKMYIYNIANRAHSYGTSDYSASVNISGPGKKVLVNGDYAYVATGSLVNQFQIFNVNNISSPNLTGQLTLGSSQAGVDVYINTQVSNLTRAYFVTDRSGTNSNFFIIDVSDTNVSTPHIIPGYLGYNTDLMSPKGITVVPFNKAIIVGNQGEEYQVIELNNETSPSHCGGLNIDTGINGVSSVLEVDGDTYSYIITGDSSAELKMIAGGPSGGGGFTETSVYESVPYPVAYSTSFNRFIADINQSYPTTKIEIQVAVSDKTCTDPAIAFSYVGPNGDSGEYFYSSTSNNKIEGIIPFGTYGIYSNPGQCFRYKLFLSTTDTNMAPTFNKMTVNYSP